jgi:hypothetical protein
MRIVSKNTAESFEKSVVIKGVHLKLNLRKASFLKRLVPLKGSQIFCTRTKGRCLRTYQESLLLHPSQLQVSKCVNLFITLSLRLLWEERVLRHPAGTRPPTKLLPQDSFPPVQSSRHSEVAEAVDQGGLATA